MANESREEVRVQRDDDFERKQRVVEQAPTTRQVVVSRSAKFVWLVFGIIIGLIAIRVVLKLIAANSVNAFASFIYGLTDIFLAPFFGLTATPATNTGMVLEIPALIAMVVYALLAFVIVRLIYIFFADTRRVRRVQTIERERL